MTVKQLFDEARAILSIEESDQDDLTPFASQWMNIVFREVLPTENYVRTYKGIAPLAVPFQVDGWTGNPPSTVIPYQDEITSTALVYGLAAQFYIYDNNKYFAQDFRNRFIVALNEAGRTRPEMIIDVY